MDSIKSTLPVWRFDICYETPTSKYDWPACRIVDFELFLELAWRLNSQSPRHKATERANVFCNLTQGSPELNDILATLKQVGKLPIFSIRRSHERNDAEFLVTRTFPPASRAELKRTPYLVGRPQARGGWVHSFDPPAIAAGFEDTEGRRTAQVVWLTGNGPLLTGWSREAVTALEQDNIQGASFFPIHWIGNPKRRVEIPFYLNPSICFPACSTPRCVGAKTVDATFVKEHGEPEEYEWDDEGRRLNIRLFYKRSEIAAMRDAGVDIARTKECFPKAGNLANNFGSAILYSQRFRQWTKKQNMKWDWFPVYELDT